MVSLLLSRPYLTENGEVVYQRSGDYWNPGYSESAWSNRDWYAEASFNYNRTFGYHNVGALLLYNQSKTYYPGSYTSIPYGYVGLVARVPLIAPYPPLYDRSLL